MVNNFARDYAWAALYLEELRQEANLYRASRPQRDGPSRRARLARALRRLANRLEPERRRRAPVNLPQA